ncbi:hypothetical protein M231_01548 [Tremella mesenterica]|uniref:Importin subunit beta-1/Transportin-1-like TPR repeats domain-containing protein n=1 Tax=Tremella mesenterica TaxID=5217 RepID=A0A4Q1BSW6_TREME|nr:hypothetical protein M231_01548 [Tremella mesenterica]
MSTEHLLGDMGDILEALMGVDNGHRDKAEKHLQRLATEQPGPVLLLLAQIGALGVGGFQVDQRFLCLLILRRLAFSRLPDLHLNPQTPHPTAPFDYITEEVRGRIETVLCTGLKDEVNVRMRKGLGTCAGKWAQASMLRKRPMTRLPPVLISLLGDPTPFHRFTTYQVIEITPTLLNDSRGGAIRSPAFLGQVLQGGLHDPSYDVRAQAIKATTASLLSQAFSSSQKIEYGISLVAEIFKSLPHFPPPIIGKAIQPLIDLAIYYPDLSLSHLDQCLPFLLSTMASPVQYPTPIALSRYDPTQMEYDDWVVSCKASTEILLSLLEVRKAQLLAWQDARVAKDLVGLLLEWQITALGLLGDDCTTWLEAEVLEDDDEYPGEPETSLDRLSGLVGDSGAIILPTLLEHVRVLLPRPEWICRYGALMGLSVAAEGSSQAIIPQIREIVNLIGHTAHDPHPRVRWAFLHCIGQMAVHCKRQVHKMYSDQIMEKCLEMMSDPQPRLRAQSITCLQVFLQDATAEQVIPYMDRLAPAFLEGYSNGPSYIQRCTIEVLGVLALSVVEAFEPHYHDVMDMLLQVLSTATEDDKTIVPEVLNSATTIGLAVGKRLFVADAARLAALMLAIQNQITDVGDPRGTELSRAWRRISAILEDDFNPFLPFIIPPLIRAAEFRPPPRGTKKSLSGEDDDGGPEDPDVIYTAELEEKAIAFENLAAYAINTKGAFMPWLEKCMFLSVDALSFQYSEDVREAAAFLIPVLLQTAKDEARIPIPDVLESIFVGLLNTIDQEQDNLYIPTLFKSFADSVRVIGIPLPLNLVHRFFNVAQRRANIWLKERMERKVLRQSGEIDEGDKQFMITEEKEESICLDKVDEAALAVQKTLMMQSEQPESKGLMKMFGDLCVTTHEARQYGGLFNQQ